MSADLRATAESIVQDAENGPDADNPWCNSPGAVSLAYAWLEEHPADEDELVTEEWLRKCRAVQIDSLARHWIIATINGRFEIWYFPLDRTLRLYASNLNADGVTTSMGGAHIVTADPTRGDVFRLVKALKPS